MIRHMVAKLLLIGLALAALSLGGCGDEGAPTPTPSPTTEQPTGTVPPEESVTPTASPVASPTPAGPEVPMFRGNPAHTGVNPGPGVEGSSKLLWRIRTGSWVLSWPAVADGVVYVGSYDGYVYALDAATGEERWRFETERMVTSSPAVVDGVVYIGGQDGYVYAISEE